MGNEALLRVLSGGLQTSLSKQKGGHLWKTRGLPKGERVISVNLLHSKLI